ncbi:RtcB family protein [Hyalangium minutum]|uniref:tRNA-splicing ligase RtcB n=1 Tax=Hyalangium minutum TaxID=394096 RepID=A0A085WKN2_9BACT|nr:RtcB family protein [Hyalangium minutum]KFE68245.1 RNA-2',3'-PO4:RNA-5'-OH ligase [Hyalangium minutum]
MEPTAEVLTRLEPLLRQLGPALYELDPRFRSDMRVPARIVADEVLLRQMFRDRSLLQLVNVTTLPGIQGFAIGMPDMHEGYGFPVGGVAGTLLPDGVISPGGIGFDINCGVRLLSTGLLHEDVKEAVPALAHDLARSIPTGFGRHGRWVLSPEQLERVLAEGVPYVVHGLGLGAGEDLSYIEAGGHLAGADVAQVSVRARERGSDQLGTLGGGNHFIEMQRVERIYDAGAAEALGLFEGQLTILIHTGSRGLGHQVCTDWVREMDRALAREGLRLVDRQLACAPFSSAEGQGYYAAMCAAANFAWANRQVLTHRVREVFSRRLGPRPEAWPHVVYDVAHNIAKLETYGGRRLCVHRKGATRAFGPGHPELPEAYQPVGQPVFIPGSMGTASFVMVGRSESQAVSFSSACHGAGRQLSRAAAKQQVAGAELRKALSAQGISVECPSNAELAEEAPTAYKDVDRVVDTVDTAGIAGKVARLVPLAVLKG